MRKRLLGCLLILFLMLSLIPLVPGSASAATTAARMNNYPIILVHGLMGWGPDQALGIRYWGGIYNIQADLRNQGYENYAFSVGKVSSNWDRACELYAQIKGGTVDYGAAHAAKYGHSRYGRTYPGAYAKWGETDPATGKTYKVHLIGHSMGGQTIRVITQLLEQGAAEEVAASPNDVSSLFTGGKSWVSGVMSISTPHDGTSADVVCNDGMPFLETLCGGIMNLMGENNLYDLMLDQWGIAPRQADESGSDYLDRVFNSSFWLQDNPGANSDAYFQPTSYCGQWQTKDMSNWDLTVEGARELNSWTKAQPDVYYFSWTGCATYKELFTGHHLPMLTMNPMMWPFASHIGSYTRNTPGQVPINSSWWPNDGLVPVVSADGPSTSSGDQIVKYSGTPQIGKWNYLGVKTGIDHMAIVGLMNLWNPTQFFRDQAKLLGTLDN